MSCTVKIYVDDLKVYKCIKTIHDVIVLQMCLYKIFDWANTWQLDISVQKCTCLVIGKNDFNLEKYSLGAHYINFVTDIRELGVLIVSNYNFYIHCSQLYKKACFRAGLILRSFYSRNVNVFIKAFIIYVRPILEYNRVIWSPYNKMDSDLIEKVQRNFISCVCSMCNVGKYLNYDQRLKLFNFESLHERQIIGDIIEVYKIVKGYTNCNLINAIPYANSENTRGHRYKFVHTFTQNCIKKHFIFNQIVNIWNSLPDNIFNSDIIKFFRNRISACMF